MKNINVIYGEESYLRKNAIDSLVKKIGVPIEEVIKYDCETTPIETIVDDAITFPFFSEFKVIVLKNPTFLTSKKIKGSLDQDPKMLIDYLDEQSEMTKLIFDAPYEKLDERKVVTKRLREKAVFKECNKLEFNELKMKVINSLNKKGYEIQINAAEELVRRCNMELINIIGELKKITLYKGDDMLITIDDVCRLVANNMDKNVFELTNFIMKKNMVKAINIANELIESKVDPIELLGLISANFRNILKVQSMLSNGYNKFDIASTLGMSPGRVSFLIKDAGSFIEEKIKDVILELADIDYKIKSGKVDRFVALDIFLARV